MEDTAARAVAIVGVGAVLPEAPSAAAFWENVKGGRYCISEVTPDRWDPALYYDPDPRAPDKTYSRIGGFVRAYDWDPAAWKLPVPPLVADSMDVAQKWAVACTRQVLQDYGKPIDGERTAVILGNAMAGERHYITSMRVNFPDALRMLEQAPAFAALPAEAREALRREYKARWNSVLPEITEDTMPGELSNCMAGRVANLFNLKGPNYVCDAACASALAALSSAAEGLIQGHFDLALTGGVDRNMGAHTFVKFCKIGALSATGTRPYADGADGFVMGEGAALYLLKRLADAERDGDRVYAVLRGVGGSSDGRGKGITAPNPVGQKLAVKRGWAIAGLDPATASLVEGHGTSTKVGDVVEVESLGEVFGQGLPAGSVPLGSVKSNIGHLKAAAGAAGLLKLALALHHKLLPPSLNCERKNPNIDFEHSPFYVNTRLQEWARPAAGVRRAGLSAFGFGGTNFHVVLEEHVPGALKAGDGRGRVSVGAVPRASAEAGPALSRGALVVGAATEAELVARLEQVASAAAAGNAPPFSLPDPQALRAPERVAIDYAGPAELAEKAGKALKALRGQPGLWRALRNQGIHRGRGPAPKVAFLYTGQGSQYVNMLRGLRDSEPVVAAVFEEADRVMTPLLGGRPLSSYLFVDPADARAVAAAEEALKQTAITQPAVLAVDVALTRLLETRGLRPDAVMGHSLGEYAALVAAGALPFADALEAVSARGREMTRVSVGDNGKMAAVIAPIDQIEDLLARIPGYVVVANYNCTKQAVIGGASAAVDLAVQAFKQAGLTVMPLPVSHAFHTRIVGPASGPLREVLERLSVQPPRVPVVANVTGELYPAHSREEVLDLLGRQVAAPVQFVKGLQTLRSAGVRVFLEVGPKKALHGFVEDVFDRDPEVLALFSNHPKVPDAAAFGQAACGLYAAGLGLPPAGAREAAPMTTRPIETSAALLAPAAPRPTATSPARPARYEDLGRLFAELIERGLALYQGGVPAATVAARAEEPVVITGAALGLPGTERLFDDRNVARILSGEQLIKPIPERLKRLMADKHVVRLVKNHGGGESHFEAIDQVRDVIKLAGQAGALDLEAEFGVPAERIAALDVVTQLAIGAGLEALRDAGLPLVLRFKTTTRGTQLPDRYLLPEALRDDTGVIFASAFPGYDAFAHDLGAYHADKGRRERQAELRALRARLAAAGAPEAALRDLDARLRELEAELAEHAFVFDRRFLFRILAMGHSQFAELIGARGPNTQINSACASTTQGLALAEDWIRAGRCRRVLLIAADDVTSDNMLEWIGSGFLASGAAATDSEVEKAALPFDRRRHGMLIGMGAAALVVESAEAARERGLRPICELLGAVTANSAYHGTRLDVGHISSVMEQLVAGVERRSGLRREEIAPQAMFMSHETYTPARGGSASAEVFALRHVFGELADRLVIANTKGFTGHPMGVGIEDVIAIKALETGLVPPVANFQEVDPELGPLNLSKGGSYPVQYALRLAAGFGSQVSMALLRWLESPDGRRRRPEELGFEYRIQDRAAWQGFLARVSGHAHPELEVVQRTLRVKNQGPPAGLPAPKARPAAAVEEPQTAPVPAAAVPAPAADPVQERVLAIVAQKTGYPAEMLGLDLDLEADLGIDTVKQAELFAAVREEWGIPRDDSRKLRDYPSLQHVIGFVREMRPDLAAAPVAVPGAAAPAPVAAPSEAPVAVDPVRERVLAIVAQKTGYPPEMLDPELDLEADLGIDTVKQAELFTAVREEWGIPRDDSRKLRDYPNLKHVVGFVHEMRPDLAAAAAPAPPLPPAADVAAPAAAGGDPVRERVLAIVSQKTGYPPDMLDPQLDLEADLGIDTVKQAELFTAVREEWGIPRDENRKLRDYPTLDHVVRFVHEMRPDLAPQAPAAPAVATSAPVVAPAPATATSVHVPRRVPVPVLRPALDDCLETGVRLEGARVLVMSDRGGVAEALVARLQAAGAAPLVLNPVLTAEELVARLTALAAEGPLTGVYWLPALDDEGDFLALDLAAWREALRVRVKLLYTAMRALYESIAAPGTFLVSGTRLGGRHGYDEAGATAALGGAVCGFTKTYKRERPEALVKVVDFGASAGPDEVAGLLLAETLRDPGAVELGHADGLRASVALVEQERAPEGRGLALGRDTVVLVTGAAGSIVSAITADLAVHTGGTFHLFDLVPEPQRDNPDLARLRDDREGLKRDVFERLKARGERATPALVERELAGLERAAAAVAALEAVERAGGRAHYYSLDLRDGAAVARACAQVRERSGRVDLLLHGAGLEISRFLPDKEPREFDLVFDVKSDGWFNVLKGLGDLTPAASVAFSSIAGRFGNGGQADYASANDLLCKTSSALRRLRPGMRPLAVDWTAWGDIGMATRGSIPKMMELAGIDMLPAAVGIPICRLEAAAGTAGEVLVAGRLGVMLDEWHPSGGLDLARCVSQPPEFGRVQRFSPQGLVIETRLDPREQPFLHDHQIDGTPVLPGVMGIETFARCASWALPGWRVAAVEELEFLAPLKFYRDEPRTLKVELQLRLAGAAVLADCRLLGERVLPGQSRPQATLHFRGRVVLRRGNEGQDEARLPLRLERPEAPVGRSEIYRVYFHGPAYRVLQEAWRQDGLAVGAFASGLPADRVPAGETLVEPRLIELCFQTAGLLEMGQSGQLGLPRQVARVRRLRPLAEGEALFAVVAPEGQGFEARVIDGQGRVHLELQGYRTVVLPAPLDPEGLRTLRSALA